MPQSCGPLILIDVLKTGIADRKAELAAIAATLLGQVIDRTALAGAGRPHPLVDALLCSRPPCLVRRRQGNCVSLARQCVFLRIEPCYPNIGPLCNEPDFASSGGY